MSGDVIADLGMQLQVTRLAIFFEGRSWLMLDFLGFSMGRLEDHLQTRAFQRYNRLYMLIIH